MTNWGLQTSSVVTRSWGAPSMSRHVVLHLVVKVLQQDIAIFYCPNFMEQFCIITKYFCCTADYIWQIIYKKWQTRSDLTRFIEVFRSGYLPMMTAFHLQLLYLRPDKKSRIHSSNLPVTPYAFNFLNNLWWGTVTKAFFVIQVNHIYGAPLSTIPGWLIIVSCRSVLGQSHAAGHKIGCCPSCVSQKPIYLHE